MRALIADSTSKVDNGSAPVKQAGLTMDEIQGRVNRVSQLVGDMAQAGSTQHEGIDRVHHALFDIDGVTQQNAALVEEVAAAAQSLKSQSDRLTQTMAAFKVAA